MEKQLTQRRLKELLTYNPITGGFHWKVAPSRTIKVGDLAGATGIRIQIDGVAYSKTRLRQLYLEDTVELLPIGVSKQTDRNGYRAQIWYQGVNLHLGYFPTPGEASAAYQKAQAQVTRGEHPNWVALGPEEFPQFTPFTAPTIAEFDTVYVPETPEELAAPAEISFDAVYAHERDEQQAVTNIKRAIADMLSKLSFPKLSTAFPELAAMLREDFADLAAVIVPKPTPPTAEELAAAAEAKITEALGNYPCQIITAPLLAELAGIDYASKSKLTWAATLRRAGWVKLGFTLLTKHGTSSIYCRRADAPGLVTKSAVEMRDGLPPGVYVGHQGGQQQQ